MSTLQGQINLTSAHSFEETLVLLKQSIESHGFWLLHEIDTQMIVRKAGVMTDGIRQLLFFHPRYIQRILEQNADAVIQAPLKFVVMEYPNAQTTLSYLQPTDLFGHYAGLQEMGIELETSVQAIVAAIMA